MGDRGSDLETETQMLLLDTKSKAAADGCLGYPYLLILPICEGPFRASLQAGKDDHIDLCMESGSSSVCQSHFKSCVYLHAGHDPFLLVRDAVKAIRAHLGTFRHMEDKTPPAIIDRFGWCISRDQSAHTCYLNPTHIWAGMKSLVEGGVPPRFLILNDGWQSNGDHDFYEKLHQYSCDNVCDEGEEMWSRLMNFQENKTFRDYAAGTLITPCKRKNYTKHDEIKHAHYSFYEVEDDVVDETRGMGAFMLDLKSEFEHLEDVYAWHAMSGYWGGALPGAPDSCNARLVDPALTVGVLGTMQDPLVDKLVTNSIGLVPPQRAHKFYDRFHAHLEKCGFTGVKLDAINVLEMLGEEHGGRLRLAKAYYDALSSSMRKNFGGNRVLANMHHSNDFMLLGTNQVALGRVGDFDSLLCDNDNADPATVAWQHGAYLVQCASNSLWMGQFLHPDWGVFQSHQKRAAFHAAARAISGGPICVNDKPGEHNLEILRKLVLPDGTILRCSNFALPTIDCLFHDPLQDEETVLKIWNLNKCGGVLGIFNCQGGGWSKEDREMCPSIDIHEACEGVVRPGDIMWNEAHDEDLLEAMNTSAFAVFCHSSSHVAILKGLHACLHVELHPLEFDIYTIVPLITTSTGLQFAALGLLNMLNTGGAVQHVACTENGHVKFQVDLHGCGQFIAYASTTPSLVDLGNQTTSFTFSAYNGHILVDIPWIPPHGNCTLTLQFP